MENILLSKTQSPENRKKTVIHLNNKTQTVCLAQNSIKFKGKLSKIMYNTHDKE